MYSPVYAGLYIVKIKWVLLMARLSNTRPAGGQKYRYMECNQRKVNEIKYVISQHRILNTCTCVCVLGFSKMLLPIIRIKETDALSANE